MIDFSNRKRLVLAVAFAIAMAYLESAVVVYLREIYYPNGFSFPLRTMPQAMIVVELARELATIVMLVVVGTLCGALFWERFGYFMILFGVWDIFYYVWLWVILRWPTTIFDWDILFLIPVPWIAPVIAPVAVALEMTVCGLIITRRFSTGGNFRPNTCALAVGAAATAAILYSFISDTGATFHQQMPGSYNYLLLVVGLALYAVSFAWALVTKEPVSG
jgi:hypothetical protein